jgi:hypothetical protein
MRNITKTTTFMISVADCKNQANGHGMVARISFLEAMRHLCLSAMARLTRITLRDCRNSYRVGTKPGYQPVPSSQQRLWFGQLATAASS